MGTSVILHGRPEREVVSLVEYFYPDYAHLLSTTSLKGALAEIADSRSMTHEEIVIELVGLEAAAKKDLDDFKLLSFCLRVCGFESKDADSLLKWTTLPTHGVQIGLLDLIELARRGDKAFPYLVKETLLDISREEALREEEFLEGALDREAFISYFYVSSQKLFRLSFNEVLLLVVNQKNVFEIRTRGYIVDFLFDFYSVSVENLMKKIEEAKKARDREFQQAKEDSEVKFLITRLKYLLFDAESAKSASKIFDLICTYGDSQFWESLIVGQVDSVSLRKRKILELIETPEVFDRVILELGYSRRVAEATSEFSKKAGSPWDKAIKY